MQPQPWYKNAIIYQIYPRSFADSDGDGIGDIKGIQGRLDYLVDLGVTALWLSPIYSSPMADFGYDVSNYYDIDSIFGTLADFDVLITEAHAKKLKVLLDFIPNHTSEQHAWFQESKSSRTNPKRDWYIWKDPKPDGSPPNNWDSVFGGSAWELDETTGQYYMHSFLKDQPDLNWANPEVLAAIQQIMRFWYDRGVDGFRIDAILFTANDQEFRDNPSSKDSGPDSDTVNQAEQMFSHAIGVHLTANLEVLTSVTREYDDRCLIFEAYPDNTEPAAYLELHEHADSEISSPFYFGLLTAVERWEAKRFEHYLDGFQSRLSPDSFPVYVLGNHDIPRLATRIGLAAARTAAVVLLTLPGTKFIYYGDELGMEDVKIPAKDRQDLGRSAEGTGQNRDPRTYAYAVVLRSICRFFDPQTVAAPSVRTTVSVMSRR
jgi:alpha-glucosidase